MQWKDLKSKLKESVAIYSPTYARRLDFEIYEIEKQGAEAYWSDLYASGKKFKKNINRLLIPFLLEMVDDDPMKDRKTPILNSVRASKVLEYKEKNG